MFNQTYGLQQAVIEWRKPITRREPYFGEVKNPNTRFILNGKNCGRLVLCDGINVVAMSRYAIGEVVAIAQRYSELPNEFLYGSDDMLKISQSQLEKGWNNKMFVKAELMPHQIKITNIRYERLQDISDEDCLKEGIVYTHGGYGVVFDVNYNVFAETPRDAFASLIDRISGKGTWESNPWVVVYNFELLK